MEYWSIGEGKGRRVKGIQSENKITSFLYSITPVLHYSNFYPFGRTPKPGGS